MDYYASTQDLIITRQRAIKEVRSHGHQPGTCEYDEIIDWIGDREMVEAQTLLQWLGY